MAEAAFSFPLENYLRRIGYEGPLEPSGALLRALHRAQVRAIPFENLSPLTGDEVSLDPAKLCAKMVDNRRGGYCFELNGLFLAALQHLGFSTMRLLARTAHSEGVYGLRSHQVTLVEVEERCWLADVGFGGNGLIEPIPFEAEAVSEQGLDRFRFMVDDLYGCRLEHWMIDRWRPLYAFSHDPFLEGDYRMINFYTSCSPDSLFTKIPLCVRTLEDRRIILFGDQLKVRVPGLPQMTVPVATEAALREVLASYFAIDWPADRELPVPRPVPPGAREV